MDSRDGWGWLLVWYTCINDTGRVALYLDPP